MYNSSIKAKRCKCSITCDKPTSMSCDGYYIYHLPLEVKEKIEREKKLKEQRQIGKVIRGIRKDEQDEGNIDNQQELILDIDRIVSRYVRLAAAGKDLKCDCYTCSTRKSWTVMQCGHFISRKHLATRWDLANMKPQCSYCNINLYGNLEVYAEKLEWEHKGITTYLQDQARAVAKPTLNELKMILCDFQQKLKAVENAKLK